MNDFRYGGDSCFNTEIEVMFQNKGSHYTFMLLLLI